MEDTEKTLFKNEINEKIDSKEQVTLSNIKNANIDNNKSTNKALTFIILIIICAIQFILIIFLFKKKKNENKETYIDKLEIHISMSLDIKAIYPTLVSMTSALENNNNEKNILVYHLLLSHNFNRSEVEKFESLKENYDFKINYYIIPNIFTNIDTWKSTDSVYYKLLIPLILPNLERIIFLDGDTLIFKDIAEMYKLPFNNNYVLGFPFHTPHIIDRFGIKSKYYINGKVLLINIQEIRKNNEDVNLLDYTVKNYQKTVFLEQDTLNYVFNNKIGFLPFKYGIYLFDNLYRFKKHYYTNFRVKVNLTEMENAIKDPSIVHLCCCNPKVWNRTTMHEQGSNKICKIYQKKFYYYANKTDYFSEIYNKLY